MPVRRVRRPVSLALAVLAVAAVVVLALAGRGAAVEARISLVLLCDIYNMQEAAAGRGGMARVAAAVAAERARTPHVLVAHAGDAISPSLMSAIDRGAHMIDLINLVRPDVFVPGNHEFDFGPEVFRARMAEARFPVFAANLADADGRALPGIGSHALLTLGPVRLGLIGLTAEDSARKSSPGGLRFADAVPTAERLASELRRQGADLVVLVAHASRALDEALVRAGIADVVLSGDDHDLLVRFDGRTALVESMEEGLYVTVVDLDVSIVEVDGQRRVGWWPRFRIVDTATLAPDPAMAARVATYEARLARELDVAIGTTRTELDSRTPTVRGGEAAIGNLFADAIRARTGADVAILNGGGFRGNRRYPPGSPLTRRDVLAELPFANKTIVLEVSGAQLRAALEQGLAEAERQTGRFPQVAGLRLRADVTRPVGDRLVRVEVNGRPLDSTGRYRLATNDFLARGGDGYVALREARVLESETEARLIAVDVMDHIQARSPVAPALEGRSIVARPEAPR